MLSSLENCSIELLCKPFLNKTTAFSTTSIVIQVVNRSKTKMKINILKKFTLNSNSYKKFAVTLMKLMNIIFLLKFLLQQNVLTQLINSFLILKNKCKILDWNTLNYLSYEKELTLLRNLHLTVPLTISYPAGIYLLKVKIETLDYCVKYVQS